MLFQHTTTVIYLDIHIQYFYTVKPVWNSDQFTTEAWFICYIKQNHCCSALTKVGKLIVVYFQGKVTYSIDSQLNMLNTKYDTLYTKSKYTS